MSEHLASLERWEWKGPHCAVLGNGERPFIVEMKGKYSLREPVKQLAVDYSRKELYMWYPAARDRQSKQTLINYCCQSH